MADSAPILVKPAAAVHEHASISRLAKAISTYSVGAVYSKAAQFAQQVLLARFLGAAGFGLYTLGYSILTVAQWPGGLGLDRGVTYFGALHGGQAGDRDRVRATLWVASGISAALSVIMAAALLVFAPQVAFYLSGGATFVPILRVFALALPAWVLYRVAAGFLQARHDVLGMTVVRNMLVPTVGLLLLGFIFILPNRIWSAAMVFLASCYAAAAYGYYRIARREADSFGAPSRLRGASGRLLRYSVALAAIFLLYQLAWRLPVFLLARFVDSASVGVYASAAALAGPPGLAADIFAQPLLPVMTQLHHGGHSEELRRAYAFAARWTYVVLLPLFGILCIAYRPILAILGKGYADSGPVLLVVSSGWMIYYIKGPAGSLLEMTGRQAYQVKNCAAMLVVSAAAGLWLVPHYGALGAGLEMALYLALLSLLEYAQGWRLYRVNPLDQRFLAVCTSAAAAFGLARVCENFFPWPAAVALGLGIYGVVFCGALASLEERRLLRSGLQKFAALFAGRIA